jgi:phosphoribosylcarboxyaminoimidazole (NCAIR) mutase
VNAAIFAAQILALEDADLREKLELHRAAWRR